MHAQNYFSTLAFVSALLPFKLVANALGGVEDALGTCFLVIFTKIQAIVVLLAFITD